MKLLHEFNGRRFYYVSSDDKLNAKDIACNCVLLIINSEEIGKLKAIVDTLTLNLAGAIAFGGSHANLQTSKILNEFNDRWESNGLLPYFFEDLELNELVETTKLVCMPNEDKFDQWSSIYVIEIGSPLVGLEAVLNALQSK